jgi:hypothetical protein
MRDTFTHQGRTFTLRIERDDYMGEPWKEDDGHGVVSEWQRRQKRPHERILVSDRDSHRFYDVRESMKIALRDGWGCGIDGHQHATKRAAAACAVDRDFEHLRAWCADEWEWVSVIVTHGDETASLSGIESNAGEYLMETARELADEIIARDAEDPARFGECGDCPECGSLSPWRCGCDVSPNVVLGEN